jgi:hypothetical protein
MLQPEKRGGEICFDIISSMPAISTHFSSRLLLIYHLVLGLLVVLDLCLIALYALLRPSHAATGNKPSDVRILACGSQGLCLLSCQRAAFPFCPAETLLRLKQYSAHALTRFIVAPALLLVVLLPCLLPLLL